MGKNQIFCDMPDDKRQTTIWRTTPETIRQPGAIFRSSKANKSVYNGNLW
jgi:hypothetical protein